MAKQRLKQGQKVAEGEYIDLLDGVNEIEKLFDAYISLRDDEYVPDEKPAPLTTEVFKDYVRRIHDAIRSTDEAVDAFKTAKDGSLLGSKTPAMIYVDSVDMFGVQLVAGRLVKTVHNVQSGTVSIPSWPLLTGLKLHKFKTFRERMDKVLEALTTRKFICKALFMDEVPMMTRISMQPEEEAKKKGTNKVTNTKRSGQVLYAKENMPKDGEPDTNTPGTGDGDEGEEADDEDTEKDMAPPPPKKRARYTRTPASVAVTINPGGRRGEKPTASRSAQPSNATIGSSFTPINASPSNQRAGAGASASNNTGQPVNTTESTPPSPMQTDGPSQPATPDPVTSRVPKQNNVIAFPVGIDHGPALQTALAGTPTGQSKLCGGSKFPGSLGKPATQYGNEWPPAYSPGRYPLPQQPKKAQPSGQHFPQQYHSPGNYINDQQASHGLEKGSPQGYSRSQAYKQRQMQSTQGITQITPHGSVSQHSQVSGLHFNGHEPRIRHVGQSDFQQSGHAAGFQPNGKVANFQLNGRMASMQHNGRIARIRLNGPHSYVVNNYFQQPAAGSPASQALPITQGADRHPSHDRFMYYDQTVGHDQDPNYGQAIEYAKTLDDDQSEFPYHEYLHVSTPAARIS